MSRIITFLFLFVTVVPQIAVAQVPPHQTFQFGTAGRETRSAMAVDSCGYVYIAGNTDDAWPGYGNAGNKDAWLAKLSASGTLIWVRQWGGRERKEVMSVAVDRSGRVYVAGYLSTDESQAWIRAFDRSGRYCWERHFKVLTATIAHDICTDCCGSVYVTGATSPIENPSIPVAFLQKRTASGNLVWSRTIGDRGTGGARGYGVAADRSGRVYVAGNVWGTLDGQPGLGGGDGFLRRFDTCGNSIWTRRYGTTKFDMSRAVTVDSRGDVYVGGSDHLNAANRSLPPIPVPEEEIRERESLFELDRVGSLRKFDAGGNEVLKKTYPDRRDVRDLAANATGEVLMAGFGYASLQDGRHGTTIWMNSLPFWTKDAAYRGTSPIVSGSVRGSLNGQQPIGVEDVFVIKYSGR